MEFIARKQIKISRKHEFELRDKSDLDLYFKFLGTNIHSFDEEEYTEK